MFAIEECIPAPYNSQNWVLSTYLTRSSVLSEPVLLKAAVVGPSQHPGRQLLDPGRTL